MLYPRSLRSTILELRHWSDAVALTPVPGALDGDLDATYWARAIGAARSGNLAQAHKDLRKIETLRQKALVDKKTELAEGMQQDYQEAEAWILHAEGKTKRPLPCCAHWPTRTTGWATSRKEFPREKC